MPLTAAIIALVTRALTDLSWTEAFLVGALLSPTDPVLSSSVVTDPRVPRLVRHSLHPGAGHFVWWQFVLADLAIGLGVGLAVGFASAKLIPRGQRLQDGIPPHQKALYALGTAFVAYGLAVLTPHGNGLIAVFVAAITLGIRRPDIRANFSRQAPDLVEIVKLGIFVVFGSLL